MAFLDDILVVFLGTATLLLLSLYTLVNCKSQIATRPETYTSFLFDAGTKRQSLAGTLGYAFSLTYYGATTIYGHLYGGWLLIFLVVVAAISISLTRRVIALAPTGGSALPRSNLLIDLLIDRLGEHEARHVLRLYVVIYFGLLVEELAVSRVVLETVFPAHPAITAVILATICVVILGYLKWGGFRAVLIADFEQLKLLFPFVLAVSFLVFRSLDVARVSRPFFAIRTPGNVWTLLFGGLMLIAWIVSAVDFYSRLNFRTQTSMPTVERRAFATAALSLASGVFLLGGLYGMFLPPAFSAVQTPSGFTENGVRFAMSLGYRSTSIIFFASLFCMIFSTINTLVVTMFQIGYYSKRRSPNVRHIHTILLWAMLCSCALWPDSVSAVGLFICALMIIPLFAICAACSSTLRGLMPSRYSFVWPGAIISVAIFILVYDRVETQYARMPLLGGLVGGSVVISAAAARLFEAIGRRYGQKNDS